MLQGAARCGPAPAFVPDDSGNQSVRGAHPNGPLTWNPVSRALELNRSSTTRDSIA
jgi:hypothetical protein